MLGSDLVQGQGALFSSFKFHGVAVILPTPTALNNTKLALQRSVSASASSRKDMKTTLYKKYNTPLSIHKLDEKVAWEGKQ